MQVALTLSGGGFRATLFHLGVIEYLRKSGLLHQVVKVASVSGGSITAAHLALHWDRYSGTDAQFREAAKNLIGFTQRGVREHIIAWVPIVWLLGRWLPHRLRFNEATMLSKLYSRYLFDDKAIEALGAHEGVPRLAIAATNLSRPANLVTFSSHGVRLNGPNGVSIQSQIIAVSHAVCASSAFPLLFPAIGIDSKMLGIQPGALTPSPQYLSDGGIYDNYGLEALSLEQQDEPLPDLLIVSDAGARAEWAPDASFGKISLLNRAAAITGQQVSDLLVERLKATPLAKQTAVVSIHQTVPKETADNLAQDLQRQLGTVRTDFDKFSNLLVHCLCSHGYAVAKTIVEQSGVAHEVTPASWNALAPNNPTTANIQNDTALLQREASRKWRLFSLKEWRPLLLYAVLVVASYWLFVPWLVAAADAAVRWTHEFVRSSWWPATLETQTIGFGDKAFLGSLQASMNEREKDQFRMDRWLRWLNDGIRPMNHQGQVIVVKSEPFKGYFKSFTVSVIADKHVKFAEGVAFLVGEQDSRFVYRPIYRQMQMRFDQSGENPPDIRIDNPNKGEYLLLILRGKVQSADPDARFPSSPDSIGLKLRAN